MARRVDAFSPRTRRRSASMPIAALRGSPPDQAYATEPLDCTGAVVLVPRRDDGSERDAIWAWVRTWWATHVGLPIIEGHHDDGPFNRGLAINRAAAAAGDWTAAVIIDSDVIIDRALIEAALAIAYGSGGPALAYTERVHLNDRVSAMIRQGFTGDWRPFTLNTYYDSCSSAIVVTRELWDAVGGFDEHFVSWGWDDVAFRCAAEVMSGRQLIKVDGTIWHLYHTISGGNNRAEPAYQANKARGERYVTARHAWDRDAILALINDTTPIPVYARDPDSPEVRARHAERLARRIGANR